MISTPRSLATTRAKKVACTCRQGYLHQTINDAVEESSGKPLALRKARAPRTLRSTCANSSARAANIDLPELDYRGHFLPLLYKEIDTAAAFKNLGAGVEREVWEGRIWRFIFYNRALLEPLSTPSSAVPQPPPHHLPPPPGHPSIVG